MTVVMSPPDNEQRRLAAGELNRNMVVLAGAGTGKTKLLIDRLTLLIVGKEIPIEKIVALTFTKKAAEEMRERLEKQLRLIIDGQGEIDLLRENFSATRDRWPSLAQKALDDIPKSQIGTIHSFAGHLLRLYPLQAGVDPAFREDKGMLAESTFDKLWKEWLKVELAAESARAKLWGKLLQRVELSELRELAWELISPMVDLQALSQKPDLKAVIQRAGQKLSEIQKNHELPKRAPKFIPAFEALVQVFSLLEKGKKVPPELVDLLDGADSAPKGWEDAEESLGELKKMAEAFGRIDQFLLGDVCELLIPLAQSVRRNLSQSGAVSFDGLLVFARNLLRDHPNVREELKRKFDTFLVDEFQDTDPLQGEILFYLAEKTGTAARRWQDVKLEPGRLFVVGDPKQSIYHFRGADIAAFEAFEEHMLNQAQPALKAELSANFRSDRRILDFVNTVFPPAMKEEKYVQPAYAALEPGLEEKPSSTPAVRIIQVSAGENAALKAGDRRVAEAVLVADCIEEQVKTGRRTADIAVLLRSANAFEEYLEEFRRRGIRYLAEGEKSFYRTSEVVDFLNLLAAVADPKDRLALTGVLRSPVGGLTDREIWELNESASLSYLHEPRRHREKIGLLFRELRELSRLAETQPLERVVREALTRTWVLETTSASSHGEQAVANLMKVGHLAEEWNVQEPMTLKEFVARLDQYRGDKRDEGENPLADVKYDAVKVLTIHKAKGLEFPVVILPNLSAQKSHIMDKPVLRRDWRTGLTGLRLLECEATNTAMPVIEEAEAHREAAEEIRVFYVAATRPRSQLICFVGAGEKEKGRFARIIKSAGTLPGVSWEQTQEKSALEVSGRPRLELSSAWNPAALAARFKNRSAELDEWNKKKIFISPTSLLAEPEKSPVHDEDEVLLPRETSINIGLVCHKVMEEWDFATPAAQHKKRITRAVQRAVQLLELLPDSPDTQATIQESTEVLVQFMAGPVYQKLSKAKIVGREVPFLYPLEGATMRGIIDLLYEENGQLVIADYKTNRIGAGGTAALEEHYRPQAETYQAAVKKALGQDARFELIFLR